MAVVLVMLAAVIDLGDQRQEKKEVTLSTDAAALAAASVVDWADPDLDPDATCDVVGLDPTAPELGTATDVEGIVIDYLDRNGGSSLDECEVVRTGQGRGYVLVSADEFVEYKIAAQSGNSVSGVSVAAIESDPGGGLRPVGMCGAMTTLEYGSYPIVSLANLFTTGSGGYTLDADGYVTLGGSRTTFVARFPIEHVKAGSCQTGGDGSGNFGKVNFGPDTHTDCHVIGHFCKDLRDGYYGTVPDPVYGDTGNSWGNASTDASLDNLRDNVGMIWAPVFGSATGNGSGTRLDLAYFAQLELVGYCTSGGCKYKEPAAHPSTKSTYFDFRVSRMIPYTLSGPPPTDDASSRPPRICSVTGSVADISANCA